MEKLKYISHLLLNTPYSLFINFAISLLIFYTLSNNNISFCMQENDDHQMYIDEINRLKRKVNEQNEYIEKSNKLNYLFSIVIRQISEEPPHVTETTEELTARFMEEHRKLLDRMHQQRCDYDCERCYDLKIREAQQQITDAWNQFDLQNRGRNT